MGMSVSRLWDVLEGWKKQLAIEVKEIELYGIWVLNEESFKEGILVAMIDEVTSDTTNNGITSLKPKTVNLFLKDVSERSAWLLIAVMTTLGKKRQSKNHA